MQCQVRQERLPSRLDFKTCPSQSAEIFRTIWLRFGPFVLRPRNLPIIPFQDKIPMDANDGAVDGKMSVCVQKISVWTSRLRDAPRALCVKECFKFLCPEKKIQVVPVFFKIKNPSLEYLTDFLQCIMHGKKPFFTQHVHCRTLYNQIGGSQHSALLIFLNMSVWKLKKPSLSWWQTHFLFPFCCECLLDVFLSFTIIFSCLLLCFPYPHLLMFCPVAFFREILLYTTQKVTLLSLY